METTNKGMKMGAINKVGVPFYEPPPRKTSAEIINEAKMAIRGVDDNFSQTLVKPLQTQRPFTPREKERLLFGKKSKSNRPPSSFSLRYLQSENEFSIPTTTPEDSDDLPIKKLVNNTNDITKGAYSKKRANSICEMSENKIFNVPVKDVPKIRLPSLDAKNKKKTFNVPEIETFPKRNAFSSPQEKTDFNQLRNESPFGRPSKKQTLSECLLLGPQNLNKIFGNKQIVYDSETLFIESGYFKQDQGKNVASTNYYSFDKTVENKNKINTVDDVLNLLNVETSKNDNEILIIDLLDELYKCMENENMINGKVNSKTKIHILKCLYKFVESYNEELLLALARIILALKVTGNNLSGVCKLIFKVAKSDKNDSLFFQKNILELFVDSIGRCSPLEDAEACVYGYGAIKFLTMNPNLLQRTINFGILPLMVLHLQLINNYKHEKSIIPEQTNHALFQLTGALRNLAGDETMFDLFIESQAISQLCLTINQFSLDLDIVSNISRTLSTLSTNDNCSDHISEYPEIYKVFIRLFQKYSGNEEIIVRLTYIMGNIVSRIDEARIKFYKEENSINSLINLWKVYLERTLKHCSLRLESEENDCGNTEDVMIKIIRIIANIAINSDIGIKMNKEYGTELIDEFLKVLISNPFKKNDELVLSVLSTLNNLSFYYSSEMDNDVFHIKQVDIVEAILEYITTPKKDNVIEAMRILGNLSRCNITRSYIAQKHVLETLLNILEADDITLLRTTVGVCVNLMADNRNRIQLKNSNGIFKLIALLNTHGQYDWSLATLTCQVIWNYCIDASNLYELITDAEMEQLTTILVDYLDEEKLFGSDSEKDGFVSQDYLLWEDFANVATNLMEKIEHFLDSIDHLEENTRPTRDSSTNISFSAW
nr:armadillo repeat-containing protein 2 isoform X1 [Onthophagus taurus]